MKDAIAAVLGGLIGQTNAESIEAYQGCAGDGTIKELVQQVADRCPDRFGLCLVMEHMKPIDGLLLNELGNNHRGRFLFRHADFIEGHVRKRIETAEGFACGADKCRTVMRCLAKHLIDGNPIQFDYSAECTFHLPKTVLNTGGEIMSFFNALQRMYYGDVAPYLLFLATYEVGNAAEQVN